MSEITLDTKLVGTIEGKFYVPSYQRGYRWGKDEVTRLLEDIYTNGTNNYCLQPVVVRKDGEVFELIDGQQRLTTLFILLQYIKREFKPRISIKYELTYETRDKSAEFLNDIDEKIADTNIDFYHIYQAYKEIDDWFNIQDDSVVAADDIYGYLVKYVKIIWYEVGEDEDAIALFARLNIGKIPLTSAELVKAMFLSKDNNVCMDREKQEEISLQWDNIEKELHNESMWAFLTNQTAQTYQTRIDLVLNLISQMPPDNREKYYTFFKFDDRRKTEKLSNIWKEIQHTFLLLKDWYENHELYHKIGYLIASGAMALRDIYTMSVGKTKHDFVHELDNQIKKSVMIDRNYAELSYEKSNDYSKISRLLLLFNVESVRQIDEKAQRFPFDRYKDKASWSLEHIHAQQSEGMRRQEEWKEWLRLHMRSLLTISDNRNNDLLEKMQSCIGKQKLERQEFGIVQQEVVKALSVEGNAEYLHAISNMALLNTSDNAALNNSTFDVKRNAIIEMDKAGRYIPFCTKMVFLKYYTPSGDNQLHFWGQADRIAYVQAINTVLKNYLPENIRIEKDGE